MRRALLINTAEQEETRAALVVDGRVEAYRRERAATATRVGNIYLGRVVNLEIGIGAAFVNIGVGRNAFLHASDCVGADPEAEPRIQEHLVVGQEVLVQVTRDSIGSKGPVLTGNVSLPGRFLVLLPYAEAGGVSRRIEVGEDRAKLRALARDLERRAGVGLIMRTAGADREEEEFVRDLELLTRLWEAVQERAGSASSPALIHAERDLVGRALRDLVEPAVAEIWVDTPEALGRAREVLETIQPELVERLHLHDSPQPLFHARDIETQIDRLGARKVSLPGGGSLVFDATEALVAVDVNSGRMRHEEGLEETALQANLEAAEEIARQLRLRDLGGVVVIDFIDMRDAEHVREVERVFREQLRKDRARLRPGRMGPFGIFALTRQRTGAGAGDGQRTCARCGGTGSVIREDEVALRVFRELMARIASPGRTSLKVRLSPEVAETLRTSHQEALTALSEECGREILLEPDDSLPPGGWQLEAVRSA